MDTKVNKNESKRARLRRPRGILVSLCFVAAIVLAVGTGAFNQRTAEVQALSDAGQATNFTEEVVEVNAAQKQEETLETVSDQTYGEYEKGKVLLLVDSTTDVEAVNAVLENTDFVETKNVSDQDISAGFVQVRIDDDMAMGNALEALEAAGLKAQPNYVYHPLEGVVSDGESASAKATETADETLETEDAHEGSMEGSNATGAEGEKNSASPASQTPENDLDTFAQLLTAASTGEGFIPSDIDAAAAVKVNDPGVSQQWMLDSLQAYKAWGIAKCKDDNASSPKVSVAIVDTGCLTTHEDLVNNIRATYNSVTKTPGVDAVADSVGHGTHVAGIVSADANNGKGVAGVSYNAGLVIIKASTGNTQNFTTESLAQAYAWLMSSTGNQTNAQAHNVRVVNMSLGGSGTVQRDDALYGNITKAKNQGILTVCAAGNQGDEKAQPPYNCIPGDYEDCFTVINLTRNSASTTKNDPSGTNYVYRFTGSNYNVAEGDLSTAKNISAPGTSIYNTVITSEKYNTKTGTSMATPAVSGVAALLFAYDPSLSAEEARAILEQTATDLGTPGWDRETGYGEVDAYRALQILSAQISSKSVLARGEQNVPLTLCCADDASIDASEWNWASSNPNVLKVDSNNNTVSAVGSGTATLTATHKSIAGRSLTMDLSVGSVDLGQASVTVDTIPAQTYTGGEIKPTITVKSDGQKLTLGTDYRVEYSDNVNAGTATVTITGGTNTNVSGTKVVKFEIKPANISRVDNISDQVYTGNPIRPYGSIFVYGLNDTKLTRDVDYVVSFSDNTEAGVDMAKAVITGKGNYTGSFEKTFTILEDFNKVDIKIDDREYTGSAITNPRIQATYKGNTLVEGAIGDYKIVSFKNNVEPGTATVTLQGGVGYTKTTRECTFKITKCDLKNVDIKPIPTQEYTGKDIRPTLSITYHGKELVQGSDYNVYYTNNKNSGTATVSVEALPTSKYYTGKTSTTFEIGGQLFSGATVSMDNFKEELVYNGEIQTQNIILKFDNGSGKTTLKSGTHYRIWYREKGSNVSVSPKGDAKLNKTYEMVVVGLSPYYSGTVVREFSIYAPSANKPSSSTNKPSNSSNTANNNSNSSNSNSNMSTAASLPAPTAPAVTGTWKKSGGKWWFQLDSKSQSSLKAGKNYPYNRWVTISGKRYYFDGGGWMKTKWLQSGSNWYWLGTDGAMKTGWIKTGGKWYYLLSNGIMQKGWLTISGVKYYLNTSSGAMLTGWQKIAGTWYYFKSSGAMAKGWVKSGGKWYHLNNTSGAMDVNWFTDTDGKKYFLYAVNGAMLTGWVQIDGTYYYFNKSGVMQKNKWVGNYYVDGNGKMLKSQWVGKYWVGSDGKWTGRTR